MYVKTETTMKHFLSIFNPEILSDQFELCLTCDEMRKRLLGKEYQIYGVAVHNAQQFEIVDKTERTSSSHQPL